MQTAIVWDMPYADCDYIINTIKKYTTNVFKFCFFPWNNKYKFSTIFQTLILLIAQKIISFTDSY